MWTKLESSGCVAARTAWDLSKSKNFDANLVSRRNLGASEPLIHMSNDISLPVVVLIVDDEAVLRFIASDVLEDNGFRVLEAEDAKTALKVLADHPDVKVLFTDVNMPGALDGLDLAREAHVRWPTIKLVVTSGRPKPADRDIPGNSRFVAKPYSPDSLMSEIRKALAS